MIHLFRLAFAALLLVGMTAPSVAQRCYKSSIMKPSPFMGQNDEIFQLSDGSIWKVQYEYEYLYAYYPEVIVCPALNSIVVEKKKLNVTQLSQPRSASTNSQAEPQARSGIIESRIDGEFEGWDGDSIYELRNGQIWQQVDGHYHYHYAYAPEVIIYSEGNRHKMKVMGDDDRSVSVRRLK